MVLFPASWLNPGVPNDVVEQASGKIRVAWIVPLVTGTRAAKNRLGGGFGVLVLMYATKLNATARRAELGGYRGFLQKCKIDGVKTESGFFRG